MESNYLKSLTIVPRRVRVPKHLAKTILDDNSMSKTDYIAPIAILSSIGPLTFYITIKEK